MMKNAERWAALSILLSILIQRRVQGFSPSFLKNQKNHLSLTASEKIPLARAPFMNRKCYHFSAKKKEVEEEEYEEYEYEEYYEYEEVEDEEEEEEEYEEEAEEIVSSKQEEIPLQDDPEDENYTAQKKLIEETIARRDALQGFKEKTSGEGSVEFLREQVEGFIDEKFEESGLSDKDVEKYFKKFKITEKAAEEAIQEKMDVDSDLSRTELMENFVTNLGTDVDVFPENDDPIYEGGVTSEDLLRLQNALQDLTGTIKGFQDGSMIDNKQAMIRPQHELDQLDRQTLDEINLCLNASATDANGVGYAEAIHNEDPTRWLLYDLDFNVTNLMLASCKHSPESPFILNHWMPQLCAYSRYADVRERDFQFTWEDCENADMDELKRYFRGLGYDEIPTFTPKETNIVNLETEYDQEDMTMAAFENWMDEVYIEEDENLYFDDEDFQPENNVFDFNYGIEDTDEVTSFKNELKEFYNEHGNETQAWKDKFVRETNYTEIMDKDGAEAFRGHLVVACCGSDKDLELAEEITKRMGDEFGKQVYVETRVYSHARQEDNLYEIWLESYDIELLHSRRGAFYNAKQWFGPADVDGKQLDHIVERVRYMISDDARYTYDLHEFESEV